MRVLVIDDHAADLRLTCAVTAEADLEVETAGSTAEALQVLNRARGPIIDAILVEVLLAREPPFGPLGGLRGFDVPRLALSGASESEHLAMAFRFGADDWISKVPTPGVLRARIEAAMGRCRAVSRVPPTVGLFDLRIDLVQQRARGPAGPIDLAPREFQVLLQLVLAAGNPVSRRSLARDVWELPEVDAGNAMEHVVSRLRSRLSGGCSVALATVPCVGWRLISTGLRLQPSAARGPRPAVAS